MLKRKSFAQHDPHGAGTRSGEVPCETVTNNPQFCPRLMATELNIVLPWRLAQETRAELVFGCEVEGARSQRPRRVAARRLGFGWT